MNKLIDAISTIITLYRYYRNFLLGYLRLYFFT